MARIYWKIRCSRHKKENHLNKKKETHFGYEIVNEEEKGKKVNAVFNSVATNYDLMNNLMSMGLHHVWKKY